MSDQQNLHDAFAEYVRRADAVGADPARSHPDRASRTPMLLVAASVVLVLAVAGGLVWFATGSGTTRGSGRPAAGLPQPSATGTPTPSPSAPMSATPSPSAPISGAPIVEKAPPSARGPLSGTATPSSVVLPRPSDTGTAAAPSGAPPTQPSASPTRTAPGSGSGIPANAKQMERAFRRVLGDTATISVKQTYGNDLIGILTATSTAKSGGFDIQAVDGNPGDKAQCEDPGKGSHCTISTPAQGGSLVVERETYDGGSDVLYFVNYVFPNGATFAMHLSNRADPKGTGRTFGPKPPLTLAQLTTIIESAAWGQD